VFMFVLFVLPVCGGGGGVVLIADLLRQLHLLQLSARPLPVLFMDDWG
jgi:hypothetical protein